MTNWRKNLSQINEIGLLDGEKRSRVDSSSLSGVDCMLSHVNVIVTSFNGTQRLSKRLKIAVWLFSTNCLGIAVYYSSLSA